MVMDSLVRRRVRRDGPNPVTSKGNSTWSLPNWGRRTTAHRSVNDSDALSLTAFYRGLTLISSTIASLPLQVFQEDQDDDAEKKKLKTPETAYLWSRPNIEMTRQSFLERTIADEVRQAGFWFVEKGAFEPDGLWWLDRRRVRVGRTSYGLKIYEVDGELPMIDYKQGGEIVHIPNWGDSLNGHDLISLMSQAVSLGLSAEEYAQRTFTQGQVPPGLLTTDLDLTEEQADALAMRWRALHAGMERSLDVAVLGNGAKFTQTMINHEEMQMLSLRQFQVQEIARLLGIPPHLLGDISNSTSWGTGIEEQNRGLLMFTLMAHIIRFEQAIDDNLLVRELTGRYCKFNLSGLLRGSTLQRNSANAVAWGKWKTTNEIRKEDELPPVPDGDTLMQPTNMAPLDAFQGMQLGVSETAPAPASAPPSR